MRTTDNRAKGQGVGLVQGLKDDFKPSATGARSFSLLAAYGVAAYATVSGAFVASALAAQPAPGPGAQPVPAQPQPTQGQAPQAAPGGQPGAVVGTQPYPPQNQAPPPPAYPQPYGAQPGYAGQPAPGYSAPVQPAPGYPAPAYPQPAPAYPAQQGYPQGQPYQAPGYPAPAYPAPVAPGQSAPGQSAPGQPAPAYPAQPQSYAPAYPVAPPPAVQPEPTPTAPVASASGSVGTPNLAPPAVAVELEVPPEGAVTKADDSEARWYDLLEVSAFADAYASVNFMTPKPQTGRNRFRSFDASNGFGFAWAGLDLRYGTPEIGGTIDLRFGPAANTLARSDAQQGLANIKQAFATWRPGGSGGLLTLDFGKFDSIYGAEVANSQDNFNYTRGLLFSLAQPMFHTGLRAALDFSPNFWLTALIANGWNNSLDNNSGKSFGLQASASVNRGSDEAPLFDVHLGYLFGPEQQDYGFIDYCRDVGGTFDPFLLDCVDDLPTSSSVVQRDAGSSNTFEAFRHLIDLVASLNPSDKFSLLFNANLGFEGARVGSVNDQGLLDGFESQSWWGVSLAGRYAFSPVWAGALRAEILGDSDGRMTFGDPHVNAVKDLLLYSATATVEAAPSSNLLIRLDARLDGANKDVYPNLLRSYQAVQPTVTLGVVAKTD